MQATQQQTLNGVDVQKLFDTIEAIKGDPTLAQCHFRASDQWLGGSVNAYQVQPFYGAHEEHDRPASFRFTCDEPAMLLGTDKGPNPVEYALGALLGCMTTTMAYHAAARGIEIEKIESSVEGDIDLRGLMQIDPKVRPGYQELRVKFRVRTDGDRELLRKLTEFSPVYNTISNPVRIVVDVETTPTERRND